MDWRQLEQLIPLAVGAMKPGSPEAAAFMQGWQRSTQQMEQSKRQGQRDQSDQAYRDAQIANMNADNQRGENAQALDRLSKYRTDTGTITHLLESKPEQIPAGTDPLQAQNNLTVDRLSAQQAYGVPAGTPQGPLPNMTALVSEGKKRRAQALIDKFDKEYGDQAKEAETSISLHTGEFAGMTMQAIRGLTNTDFPPAPPKPKSTSGRNLQSKEMMRNGQRSVVNFEPDSGKYFDLQDNPITDIAPIAPASASQPGQLPPATQRLVDAKSKGFDSQAVVKNTQKMAEAVSFANSLDVNTKNPSDDQALIYAFAKAMDPDSVVREGEYATVQKYSQSWAQRFGFDVARIFSNTAFLTADARQNMKTTIEKKYQAGRTQYDNVRKSYASQIDKITGQPGSGEGWLVDYGGAFPASAPAAPDSQLPLGVTVKRRQ